MKDFDGLNAMVTGGASGIGLATARLLAEPGANVAVLDLDPAGLPEPLIGFKADVVDDEATRLAVHEGVAALGGRLDILVNNAGVGAQGDRPTRLLRAVRGSTWLSCPRRTPAAAASAARSP